MIARAWYVRCDECGNPAEVATKSAVEAKEYARQQGFIVKSRRWLCPWGCRQAAEAAEQIDALSRAALTPWPPEGDSSG